MGKRQRRTDKTPLSPAFISHTSQTESSSKEKSSQSFGSTREKPTSSLTNIMERSTPVHHQSPTHHHHHNFNRPLLSRVPHHYHNIQHSQRKSHSFASTSHGKTDLLDDKSSWKFGHRPESGFGHYTGRKDKASRRLDKVRSNPLVMEYVHSNSITMNFICGLCQQKANESHVVAVLVCGHIYHADCLEIRTRNDDRRDPPCPLCMPSVADN